MQQLETLVQELKSSATPSLRLWQELETIARAVMPKARQRRLTRLLHRNEDETILFPFAGGVGALRLFHHLLNEGLKVMAIERSLLADPVTLSKISRLELRARLVVEGVIAGMHKSPYHGFSVEFAQHREYTPGDEIRYIDWKVFGRSDRHYIKQFEEETNLKAYLLLDASSSMTYKSGALSKLEYGAVVGVALASLLIQQRDAVGLVTFDAAPRRFLPARAATSQLRQIVEELENVTVEKKTSVGAVLHDIAERVKRRSLMILISDLFESAEQVLLGLQHFRHKRHEVIVFHVLDRDEIAFPFRDLAMFRDLEGEVQLLADPPAIRRSYLRAFGDYVTALQRGCREMGIDYVQMPTDEPVDVALWNYLAMRMKR